MYFLGLTFMHVYQSKVLTKHQKFIQLFQNFISISQFTQIEIIINVADLKRFNCTREKRHLKSQKVLS